MGKYNAETGKSDNWETWTAAGVIGLTTAAFISNGFNPSDNEPEKATPPQVETSSTPKEELIDIKSKSNTGKHMKQH